MRENEDYMLNNMDVPKEDLDNMINQGDRLIALINNEDFKAIVSEGYLEVYYADMKQTMDNAAKEDSDDARQIVKEITARLKGVAAFHGYLDDILSLRKFALGRLENE